MSAAIMLLAALLFRSDLWAEDNKDQAPSFSSDSIVNAASSSSGSLTPNAIASLYGTNLAYFTAAVSLEQVGSGTLPNKLGEVQITVGNTFARLLYVSPTQINFLVPTDLLPGRTTLKLVRQATSTQAPITLLDAAPGIFVMTDGRMAATHADGSLITPEAPAAPSEIIVIYVTGLGRTDPRQLDGVIPRAAASMLLMDRLGILLDDELLRPDRVLYAGITPGFPGLYQINVRLPDRILKPEPELRVLVGLQASQTALSLAVAPSEP